ncbi:hypothetical protein BDV38DRAFT_282666 [Aspergillus pseudotamarii]|uniref:Receptor L-domain domain-containing protein n=1 Tax=Aspergillus pseudotamarii TaxID=132259 RepID=A0A5N6SSX9_ASPPS|nr:uncharacterized protein BDV38DRAFT_282666 [Aspergillus pseudotamarii]KAE8137732.1 hypothetical protein BDV38DRAFT_282666 [Aspergillus pseudotamarii]
MAQICTPEYGYEAYSYIINNQSDLDEISAKCTIVNGSIAMSYNYTGAFHLPNIRNITGSFKWFQYPEYIGVYPEPTSISLPDLEFLGHSLYFNSLPALKSFTAPKLKTVGWNADIDYAEEVDLRSLAESEYLSVRGNVSSLRLDSLRQVRQLILICNKEKCSPEASPHDSLDVSLPALHDVGHLHLEGRFSSLDTPMLNNITGAGPGYYGIKLLTVGGPPINVSFPELKHIKEDADMSLEGNIASLSMPGTRNLNVLLNVNAYDRLDINLPFEEAGTIVLRGNISSVQLPNLKSVDELLVNTDASLDCKSLKETIMTATNRSDYQLTCTVRNSASHLGLNLGVKVAFGSVENPYHELGGSATDYMALDS